MAANTISETSAAVLANSGEGEAPAAQSAPVEHFIPLRKADLVARLAADIGLPARDQERLLEFCRRLEAAFHYEYHLRLEELKDAYAPFDPDADTLAERPLTEQERDALTPPLFEKFSALLARANFRRLPQAEIEEAVDAYSDWGLNLHVDFRIFQQLEVYARGDGSNRRDRRRWQNLYRFEEVDVPVYQRLVIMFRLLPNQKLERRRCAKAVYIKIFKDIPKLDLDMLLPGSRVKMSLFDQGKIWFPTATGVSLALYKIVAGAAFLAYASVSGVMAFVGLVAGTVGYGVKSFFGYLRTKDKHQLNLTRSLYFQNLDNNAGVLFRLINEAEEQEFREAALAYYLLWRQAGETGWTPAEIDRAAEAWLLRETSLPVDFEVEDALEKLRRLNLVETLPDNRLRAVPLETALANLATAWSKLCPRETPVPKPHLPVAMVP